MSEEPIQVMPICDNGGVIKIYKNHVEMERNPPLPEPEPQRFMTQRMSEKTKAEMEGGAAAVRKHQERAEWARNFNATRQKLPSELASEYKEALASGKTLPVDLNPGNLGAGRHTTEGDPAKTPHVAKKDRGTTVGK